MRSDRRGGICVTASCVGVVVGVGVGLGVSVTVGVIGVLARVWRV